MFKSIQYMLTCLLIFSLQPALCNAEESFASENEEPVVELRPSENSIQLLPSQLNWMERSGAAYPLEILSGH